MVIVIITFSRLGIKRYGFQSCLWSTVSVLAAEFNLARRVQPSRPASARSFSTPRLNLVLVHGSSGFPRRRPSIPSTAIGSGQSRWHLPPRALRNKASCPQGSSSNGCCLFRKPHGSILVRPSFLHPLLVQWTYAMHKDCLGG